MRYLYRVYGAETVSYTHLDVYKRQLSILGTLGVSCYILADTFFVSAGLGAKGLAALNLAIPGLHLFLMTYSCAS